MKKVLKFSGIFALLLGAVGFILMMATPALTYSASGFGGAVSGSGWISGVAAIFGKGPQHLEGTIPVIGNLGNDGNFEGTLAWNALLAFIFAIVAVVIVCLGVVLPLLKIKALEKFSGILSLVAIGLFVAAGVFLFFTVPAFSAANNGGYDSWTLGVGWIIGAILYLVAAAFAALPVVAQILKK